MDKLKQRLRAKLAAKHLVVAGVKSQREAKEAGKEGEKITRLLRDDEKTVILSGDLNSWNLMNLLQVLARDPQRHRRFEALFNLYQFLFAAHNMKRPRTLYDLSTDKAAVAETVTDDSWGGASVRVNTISKLSWSIYENGCLPQITAFLKSTSSADVLIAMKMYYHLLHWDGLWAPIHRHEPAFIPLVVTHLASDHVVIRVAALCVIHQLASHHSSHEALHAADISQVLRKKLCPSFFFGAGGPVGVYDATQGYLRCKPTPEHADNFLHNLPNLFLADAFAMWIAMMLGMHPDVKFAGQILPFADWAVDTIIIASFQFLPSAIRDESKMRGDDQAPKEEALHESAVQWAKTFADCVKSVDVHMALVYSVEVLHLCLRHSPELHLHLTGRLPFVQALHILQHKIVPARADPRLKSAVERLFKVFMLVEQVDLAKEMPDWSRMMRPNLEPEQRLCSNYRCFKAPLAEWQCVTCRVVSYCSKECHLRHRDCHAMSCGLLLL